MRQPGGHFAQAFEISFQRYLFAQTRDFGDVGYQAERSAGSRLAGIDRGDRRAQTLRPSRSVARFDLFATIDVTTGQACLDHFCQSRHVSEDVAQMFTWKMLLIVK